MIIQISGLFILNLYKNKKDTLPIIMQVVTILHREQTTRDVGN